MKPDTPTTRSSLLTPERAARIRDAFDVALDLPSTERDAWIASAIADADDRRALHLLLQADAAGGPLDIPSGERIARIGTAPDAPADALVGQRIGAFRLLRLLGEGGMAAVFLGEREDAAFAQQVAVKLLRRGLYSAAEQRLFAREQQALAALSHPNIAHLIDGGVSDAGIPYLVLEYVDGVPLTRYVADRALGLRERLALFVVVCRAVAAAHRQLIVHRDLKPANILVDGAGRVKLLDFGIAKFLAEDDDGATRNGHGALTPGYAAPEQYAGGTITTATDVYALGVVLQELLLGGRVDEAGTDDATKPSALVQDTTRVTWPLPMPRTTLRAALRGDLDDIVRHARAPEPERRYVSANELADDVERHLDGQPVRAHPPSGWYRTRKFVRRHRGSVALTAAFAIGVLASLSVALWQADAARAEAARARAEAQRANAEAQRANATRDFLESLFEPVSLQLAEGSTPSLRDLVASGAKRLETATDLAPAPRVELLLLFSRLQSLIAEPAAALALAERAHALAATTLPADSPLTLLAAFTVARSYAGAGDVARAAPLLHAVEDRMQASGDIDGGVDVIELYAVLGAVENELGRPDVALAYARREFAARSERFPPDHAAVATGHNNLGYALEASGEFDDAIVHFTRAYEIDAKALEPDSLQRSFPLGNLAQAEFNAGRLVDARRHFAQAMAINDKVAMEKPSRGELGQISMLVHTELALGALDRAEALIERYRDRAAASSPTQNDQALARRLAATLAIERGDFAAARAHLDAVVPMTAPLDDRARDRLLGRVAAHRGEMALAQGRPDDAVRELSRGLALMGDVVYPAFVVPYARALLAQACGARIDAPCTRGGLDEAIAATDVRYLRHHPAMLGAQAAIARALLDRGDRAAAVARLDDVIAAAGRSGVDATSPRFAQLRALRDEAQRAR